CRRVDGAGHRAFITDAPNGRGIILGTHDTTRSVDAGRCAIARSWPAYASLLMGIADAVAAASGQNQQIADYPEALALSDGTCDCRCDSRRSIMGLAHTCLA